MFIDLLVDPLADRLRHFIRRKASPGQHNQDQSPQHADLTTETGWQGQVRELHSSGFFHQAKDFTINNPTMVEVVNNMISVARTALDHLMAYTESGAAMDSSARDPPPKCHPGTRLKIGRKLETWLDDPGREWSTMWLRGPAGTGKSAIAQTFAEHCYDKRRLGAAFFSRPNNRDKPETVIPTLAYQLAVHCRGFNAVLTKQLAGDPQLVTKAPHVQLRRLIIEPLLIIQAHEHEYIEEPFMIIIDGLDECEGERAQFEFVNMINEVARLKNLPLLWLICSRPEAHLQYAFSRVAYCSREELFLNQECRDDVDRYLRDELAAIKNRYEDITPPLWPSEDQFHKLSGSVSGLFVFASISLKYIGDPIYANPVNQLKKLLAFLKRADTVGTKNPLAALDLLYAQILTDVPEEIFQTAHRILAYIIHMAMVTLYRIIPAQHLCNFLRIDKSTFYSALRKLHSVIAVPAPEDASKAPLRFHHTSFQDFLLDPNRSGKFAIGERKTWVDIAKTGLFWHNIDTMHFHINDGRDFDHQHRHTNLPNLQWVSPDNERDISANVARIAMLCWRTFDHLSGEIDEGLSARIRDVDFRYVHRNYFPRLANWLYRQDPSDPIVRTTPSSELDVRLLEYLRAVIGQGRADPAIFPLPDGRRRVYFFVGYREKTIIVLLTEHHNSGCVYTFNLDKELSLQQIKEYQDSLVEIGWSDELE